jgi:hypothetical protein
MNLSVIGVADVYPLPPLPGRPINEKEINWIPGYSGIRGGGGGGDQVKGQGHPRKGQERGRPLIQEEDRVKG